MARARPLSGTAAPAADAEATYPPADAALADTPFTETDASVDAVDAFAEEPFDAFAPATFADGPAESFPEPEASQAAFAEPELADVAPADAFAAMETYETAPAGAFAEPDPADFATADETALTDAFVGPDTGAVTPDAFAEPAAFEAGAGATYERDIDDDYADFVQPVGADIGAAADDARLPWEIEQATAAERAQREPDWPMPAVEAEAAAPWGEDEPAAAATPAFPLDAFIVPDPTRGRPTGYEEDPAAALAERVSAQLEELAQRLRARGLGSLADADSADDLARIIAAVVTGYLSRESR